MFNQISGPTSPCSGDERDSSLKALSKAILLSLKGFAPEAPAKLAGPFVRQSAVSAQTFAPYSDHFKEANESGGNLPRDRCWPMNGFLDEQPYDPILRLVFPNITEKQAQNAKKFD